MKKKYYELYVEIKDAILTGVYKAGEKIPSKRVTADKKGLSLITVENAYSMLYEEGYIEPIERSGYYVRKIDRAPKGNLERVKPKLLEETTENKEEFEYSVWAKTVRKVISEKGDRLFTKSPVEGVANLRNAISEYLFRYRGMIADPNRIIIGSGAEQLYENAVKILGREKVFGIEDPCYEGIKAVYKGEGVRTLPLKMGKEGIESEELESKKFNVLHVTPFNSYPSGITASVGKRFEYLSWAKGKGTYIIEDDFASEFFTPGQPIESLYSIDEERVIYINTFSKSLSPSMRMGYMILPQALMSEYYKKLGGFSCSVPVLDQYVLAEFISSGSFERHLNRLRRKMNK